MRLNQRQWIALACGVLLFALSALFPPWLYIDGSTSAERSAGYHSRAPDIKSDAEMRALFGLSDKDEPSFTVVPDWWRLFGQLLAIPFLLLGFLLLLRDNRQDWSKVVGTLSLIAGLAFAAFVVWLTLE